MLMSRTVTWAVNQSVSSESVQDPGGDPEWKRQQTKLPAGHGSVVHHHRGKTCSSHIHVMILILVSMEQQIINNEEFSVCAADSSQLCGFHCEGSRRRRRHDHLHYWSIIGKIRPVHILLTTSRTCLYDNWTHLSPVTCSLMPGSSGLIYQTVET